MTRVSFYILKQSGEAAQLSFACKLTEKAHSESRTVYLHAQAGVCAQLDALLWTFRQGSFVPHAQAAEAQNDIQTPVIIGHDAQPPAHLNDVLINLAADVPPFFSSFERAIEIVTPDNKEPARQRYKFYADRGYELETHNIA